MEKNMGIPTLPTDPVLNMHMEPNSGFHLSELDFNIIVTSGNGMKEQVIDKSECQRVDDDNYLYYPDTELLGRGKYYAKLIVQIPDPAHPKGFRTLSDRIEAGITIA